jgi:2-keto-3-deoxy-6-phosphogluconate aldolase
MSGVNAELMKLLFPAYVELITLKAAEQRQAALLSGKATASDIAAGVALGRAVAAVFVARAGSDGMGAAVGSPALWATLPARAGVRGDPPWQSMETRPVRPCCRSSATSGRGC